MFQPAHNPRSWYQRFAHWTVVVALLFAVGVAGYARPAQAQWVTMDIPQTVGNIWDKIKDAATWAFEHGAAIAFRNAAKTFTQQIAYNAAVQLTSGGQGQLPLFQTKNFGQVISDAADSAAGDYIDKLASSFVGFNVCNPGGLNAPSAKLIIGTALFQEIKPQQPESGCKLSQIRTNWERTLNDPAQRTKLLSNFTPHLDPKQNDLGIALHLQSNLINTKNAAKENAGQENVKNLGYLPLTESITGFIKTPAPELKSSRDFTTQQIFSEPLVFTGDIVADALGVFTNTFAARFMKRLQQGIVPQPSKLASSRFGNGLGAPAGGVEYAIQVNSSISTPEIKQEDIDVISDFSDCPQDPKLAPLNNCTINTRFVQALRSAQSGAPLTVQEAIDKGLLAGNWVFKQVRPGGLRNPDAWYLSDLKKLRKARIIPVGWELTAGSVIGTDKTLQQVIGTKSLNYSDGFNEVDILGGCNTSPAQPSDFATAHPSLTWKPAGSFCGLIDPDWVLKAPPAQCRMLAYGQQLEFQGGQRQQVCVDTQNCVAENGDGSCQAWGYCTKEKNIWRFSGESCEFPEGSGYSPYATCQTFSDSAGQTDSYLKNSLANFDDGVCSGAGGCKWYSAAFSGQAAATDATRYSDADASRVYLKNTERYGCDAQTEGCHQFLRLSKINVSAVPGTCSVTTTQSCIASADCPSQLTCVGGTNAGAACTTNGPCTGGGTCGEICVKPGTNPVEQVVNYVTSTPSTTYQSLATTQTVHLREAPEYLHCYDTNADGTPNTTNDGADCKNYLQFCKAQEAGCELYRPQDGGPGVPAVASVNDTCSAECAGFNSYEQLPSFFDRAPKFCSGGTNDGASCSAPGDCTGGGICTAAYVNFIPKTAQQCSASQVGCEEFTNVQAGERKEYYSQLRQCIASTDVDDTGNSLAHTYYTWVGSDLTGYQLKTWQLQATPPYDANSAPLTTDSSTDCRVAGVFPTSDPDCKQFYDSLGGQHYVLASLTISASDSCTRYRATTVTQTDCTATNGTWEPSGGAMACFYRAIPNEGKSCSASAASCREYRGPTANNVKLVFPISTFGDTERGLNADPTPTGGWSPGTNSTESTSAFGHSLNSGSTGTAGKTVTGLITPGSQYLLTFWARTLADGAEATISGTFINSVDTSVSFSSTSRVTNEWQVYTLGPVLVPSTWNVTASSQQVLALASSITNSKPNGFYLDNVALREVADTFFVRKGSWQTPLTCQAPDDLRCSVYTDRKNQRYTLTGFSQLCRAEAVGCEALVDTRNTESPRAADFSTLSPDNQAALASLNLDKADQVVYRVYDKAKACAASAQACYRFGAPQLATSGTIESWADTFVKLDPDSFTTGVNSTTANPLSPLCSKAQDRCAEFKDASGGTHTFRDPGNQTCEYKQVNPQHGYDWYKKGTNPPELCNLVPNSSFEQFKGSADDSKRDIFPSWERNGGLKPDGVTLAVEDEKGEPYAVSSTNGQYWGATALKVRGTKVEYSGVWSKQIPIPALPDGTRPPRLFLFTGRLYIPVGASITPSTPWELARHALIGGACASGTCHHYSLLPGGSEWVGSADPTGQWLTRSYVIKTEVNVDALEVGVITNVSDVAQSASWKADQEVYVDDVHIVELPATISDDQARSLASAGFANLCPADQSSCSAFRDPALTKATYYYLDNSKLDAASCSGQVSEKNGCLLFNNLSQGQVTWSSQATYDASRQSNNQAVAPAPPPATAAPIDTNTVLKVRRDRVCDEWLSCQSDSVRFSGNQAHSICYALGRCNQWGSAGTGKCGNWLNPETDPQPLTAATYQARGSNHCSNNLTQSCSNDADCGAGHQCQVAGSDSTRLDWADVEYSGYSIPNIYPIDVLTQKNYSSDPENPDLRLTYLRNVYKCNGIPSEPAPCASYGTTCVLSTGGDGTCQFEDFGVSGAGPGESGRWQATAPKLCRAYPEADSPFPESVVKEWDQSCSTSAGCQDLNSIITVAKTRETGFKDSNTCQRGQSCECTYQRASYTQGESLFYGFDSKADPWFSVDTDGDDTNTKDIYSRLKKRDYLIGLKGYCLEKDPSHLVNVGSSQDQACLTWLPLDVVGGDISIYDYANEAGFNDINVAYYCSAQASHQYGTSPYVLPYGTAGCETGISQGWRKETSLVLPAGPPVYHGDIESIHIGEMRTADDGGSCWNSGDDCAKGDVLLSNHDDWCAHVDYEENKDECDGPQNCNDGGGKVDQMRNGGALFRPSGTGWNSIGNYGAFCGGHWSSISAMAIFDTNDRFLGINISGCSDYGGSGSVKIDNVTVTLKRNYCSELTKVADNVNNKAWTNRTLNPSSGYSPRVGAAGETYTFTISGKPFGAVVGQLSTAVAGKLSPLVPVQQSGPLYAAAPYSCSSLWPGYDCTVGNRFNRCVGGSQSPNACTAGSPSTCTGGACIGTVVPVAKEPVPPPQSYAGVKILQDLFAKTYDVFRLTGTTPEYNKLSGPGWPPFSLDISNASPNSLQSPKLSYRSLDYANHTDVCGVCAGTNTSQVQGGDNYFCSSASKRIEANVQTRAVFSVPADSTEVKYNDSNIAKVDVDLHAYSGNFIGGCNSSYFTGLATLELANGWCRVVGTADSVAICAALPGDNLVGNASPPAVACGSDDYAALKAVFDSLTGQFKGYNVVSCDGSGGGGGMTAVTTIFVDPAGAVGVPYQPLVRQVVFDGNTKAPSEGRVGFTLVSVDGPVTQGDVSVLSPAPVTALFYAYNPNGEQMPLREVLVDWDGNPLPGVGYTSGSLGKYKNRKHICASPKECKGGASPGKVCSADADCVGSGATCVDNVAYNFGDSSQACIQDAPNSEGYFSFTKVFLCSGNETPCVSDEADGCYKADALGSSGGACIFSPKVYVRDNWEWCPGSDGRGRWGEHDSAHPSCDITRADAWLPSSQTSPVRILVKPKS